MPECVPDKYTECKFSYSAILFIAYVPNKFTQYRSISAWKFVSLSKYW